MFEAGDYVIYGHNGICQVKGTTTLEMEGVPKNRLYYILTPQDGRTGTIYTPTENGKLVLRSVMSREEAEQLIQDIPDIETLDIENDKRREEKYKECLRTCDGREMLRVIKTIYLRKSKRLRCGKKATAVDERYMKMAENNLYSELSMLLEVPKDEMVSYIAAQVKKQEKNR